MSNADRFEEWCATPLGQYLLAKEQAYHDEVVADIFGFHALQLGFPGVDFLQTSRITHKFRIDRRGPADVLARYDELPVDTQSIDLLVLPHVLEFTEQPHRILREIDRVMMPEGRIIITAFNPWSLWGMRRWLAANEREYPWCGNFISLVRMKDWLSLLGFEVSTGRLGCYLPPINEEKWLARFRFLEDAGDRWWAIGGGVYMLEAIKRVPGMRVITPAWSDAAAREKRLATAHQGFGRAGRSGNLRVVKKERQRK